MGQKTHPIGFRLGIIRDWDAKWFARKGDQYRKLLSEDMTIRKTILGSHTDAAISKVEIERKRQRSHRHHLYRPTRHRDRSGWSEGGRTSRPA